MVTQVLIRRGFDVHFQITVMVGIGILYLEWSQAGQVGTPRYTSLTGESEGE